MPCLPSHNLRWLSPAIVPIILATLGSRSNKKHRLWCIFSYHSLTMIDTNKRTPGCDSPFPISPLTIFVGYPQRFSPSFYSLVSPKLTKYTGWEYFRLPLADHDRYKHTVTGM